MQCVVRESHRSNNIANNITITRMASFNDDCESLMLGYSASMLGPQIQNDDFNRPLSLRRNIHESCGSILSGPTSSVLSYYRTNGTPSSLRFHSSYRDKKLREGNAATIKRKLSTSTSKKYVLNSWTVKPAIGAEGVVVTGFEEETEKERTSCPIDSRITSHMVISNSGVIYNLNGPMQKPEIHDLAYEYFRDGFPDNWKLLVRDYMNKLRNEAMQCEIMLSPSVKKIKTFSFQNSSSKAVHEVSEENKENSSQSESESDLEVINGNNVDPLKRKIAAKANEQSKASKFDILKSTSNNDESEKFETNAVLRLVPDEERDTMKTPVEVRTKKRLSRGKKSSTKKTLYIKISPRNHSSKGKKNNGKVGEKETQESDDWKGTQSESTPAVGMTLRNRKSLSSPEALCTTDPKTAKSKTPAKRNDKESKKKSIGNSETQSPTMPVPSMPRKNKKSLSPPEDSCTTDSKTTKSKTPTKRNSKKISNVDQDNQSPFSPVPLSPPKVPLTTDAKTFKIPAVRKRNDNKGKNVTSNYSKSSGHLEKEARKENVELTKAEDIVEDDSQVSHEHHLASRVGSKNKKLVPGTKNLENSKVSKPSTVQGSVRKIDQSWLMIPEDDIFDDIFNDTACPQQNRPKLSVTLSPEESKAFMADTEAPDDDIFDSVFSFPESGPKNVFKAESKKSSPSNLKAPVIRKIDKWAVVPHQDQLCVEGYLVKNGGDMELFRTSPIVEVSNAGLTVHTTTGSRYDLIGKMVLRASVDAGISVTVARRFLRGFPAGWEKRYVNLNRSDCGSYQGNCTPEQPEVSTSISASKRKSDQGTSGPSHGLPLSLEVASDEEDGALTSSLIVCIPDTLKKPKNARKRIKDLPEVVKESLISPSKPKGTKYAAAMTPLAETSLALEENIMAGSQSPAFASPTDATMPQGTDATSKTPLVKTEADKEALELSDFLSPEAKEMLYTTRSGRRVLPRLVKVGDELYKVRGVSKSIMERLDFDGQGGDVNQISEENCQNGFIECTPASSTSKVETKTPKMSKRSRKSSGVTKSGGQRSLRSGGAVKTLYTPKPAKKSGAKSGTSLTIKDLEVVPLHQMITRSYKVPLKKLQIDQKTVGNVENFGKDAKSDPKPVKKRMSLRRRATKAPPGGAVSQETKLPDEEDAAKGQKRVKRQTKKKGSEEPQNVAVSQKLANKKDKDNKETKEKSKPEKRGKRKRVRESEEVTRPSKLRKREIEKKEDLESMAEKDEKHAKGKKVVTKATKAAKRPPKRTPAKRKQTEEQIAEETNDSNAPVLSPTKVKWSWQKNNKLNKLVEKKLSWDEIAVEMKCSSEECMEAYKNLFKTKEKATKKRTKKSSKDKDDEVTANRGTLKHRQQVREKLEVLKNPKPDFQDLFSQGNPFQAGEENMFSQDLFAVSDPVNDMVPLTPNTKPPVGFGDIVETPAWFKTPQAGTNPSANTGWTPYLSAQTPSVAKDVFSPQVENINEEEKRKEADRVIVQMQKKMMKGTLREFNEEDKAKRKQTKKTPSKKDWDLGIDYELFKDNEKQDATDEVSSGEEDEYFEFE